MKDKDIFRVEVKSPWDNSWKLLTKEFTSEADAQWMVSYYRLVKGRDARYAKIQQTDSASI